ncbi:hypothetical protein K3495_g14409 [Podosphaera aphanis]|nr:hypothetical protein K3495_g14409 [Podosphaera aphanis]
MSSSNASNSMGTDPFVDVESRNMGNASMRGGGGGGGGGVGGARKAPPNTDEEVKRFKEALKDESLAPRTLRKMLMKAIEVIENLRKAKTFPTHNPTPTAKDTAGNATMAKILQEVQSMKVTINGLARPQDQSWAKVASKTGTTGATIRIQDESEKQEIAKLSSEELVKKTGMKEVIGARKMVNGQVRVFFTGEETKKIMETQKDWTQKIAPTAHLATPIYQVLIHNMPLTFNPEDKNQVKELQQTNLHYIQGITIQKAAWLKRTKVPGKTSGSLIVWFDRAEQADLAITKGMMWRYELKATEIFRSGFRLMQCFNCQKYGHISKTCSAPSKCGHCAGDHNTRTCPGKQDTRCCNCGRKHEAWNQICPNRIAAKAKATANRIHDSGKHMIQESRVGNQENGWQIVDSRKRRAGTSVVEFSRPVGEVVVRRGPGRPRKNPGLDVPDMRATWEKMLNTPNTPTPPINKENEPRTVARDNQVETNGAPECEMQS